ncbi:MAG: PIN domain-containing protein [Acidobacteria bacterium]|nr:PIN domain-containing protein [Acidobacteriota bacterium]
MKAFLDTHAAVALEEGALEVFGPASTDLLERAALFLSPVVSLELAFLAEIGRLTVEPDEVAAGLHSKLGVTLSEDPIAAVIREAMGLTWTRDPFDRLLVATARLHRAPLITRDRNLHEHFPGAVW